MPNGANASSAQSTPRYEPLTADYDLFAVFPHLETLENRTHESRKTALSHPNTLPKGQTTQSTNDQLKTGLAMRADLVNRIAAHKENPSVPGYASTLKSLEQARDNSTRNALKGAFTKGADLWLGRMERKMSSGPSGDKGILNKATAELITKLNTAIRGTDNQDGDVFLHGTEMDNPYPEHDEEVLIFPPSRRVYRTQNLAQIQQIFKLAQRNGYIVYENRKEPGRYLPGNPSATEGAGTPANRTKLPSIPRRLDTWVDNMGLAPRRSVYTPGEGSDRLSEFDLLHSAHDPETARRPSQIQPTKLFDQLNLADEAEMEDDDDA